MLLSFLILKCAGLFINRKLALDNVYFGIQFLTAPSTPFELEENIVLRPGEGGRISITYLNIYVEDIKQLLVGHNCSNKSAFLTWDLLLWEYKEEPVKSTVDLSSICKQNDKILFHITKSLMKENSNLFCKRIGGSLYFPEKKTEMEEFLQNCMKGPLNTSNSYDNCYGYWTTKTNSSAVDERQPTCIYANMMAYGEKAEIPCDYAMCFLCSVPVLSMEPFLLRGHCYHSNIFFNPLVMADGTFYYSGYKDGIDIVHNREKKIWEGVDRGTGAVYAESYASYKSLLIGVHEWSVKKQEYAPCAKDWTLNLTITACKIFEFTCSNGACISLNHRCDGRYDCMDGSDEDQCELVVLRDGYDKGIVPPALDLEQILKIRVFVNVQEVIGINEIKSLFHAKFKISVSWFDRRISFHNLINSTRVNILLESEKEKIWVPKFSFLNLNKEIDGIFNNEEVILIQPNKDYQFLHSGTNNLLNNRIFNGENNSLLMSTTYSPKLFCSFDQNMILFPFDTQTCSIDVVTLGNLELFADIKLGEPFYSGTGTFSGFYFKNIENCNVKIDDTQVLRYIDIVGIFYRHK